MSIIQLYLFEILHEAEFILRHLSGIINKTISKVAIVKVLYHALKLRVHSDKEACAIYVFLGWNIFPVNGNFRPV